MPTDPSNSDSLRTFTPEHAALRKYALKKSRFMFFPAFFFLIIFSGTSILFLFQTGLNSSWWMLSTPFLCISLPFLFLGMWGTSREMRKWAGFRVELGADFLRIYRPWTEKMELTRYELQHVREHPWGGLVITDRTEKWKVEIPHFLEGYDEIKNQVTDWV